jgi:hypothetical protein
MAMTTSPGLPFLPHREPCRRREDISERRFLKTPCLLRGEKRVAASGKGSIGGPDAGSAPQRVLAAHSLDEVAYFLRGSRATGEDDSIHAAMRADAMLEAGDLEGRAVWLRIIKVVDELLAKERPASAKLH